MNNSVQGFPCNVMKYSALRYMQKKLSEKVSLLPNDFKSLEEWEKYKSEFIAFLMKSLPVKEISTGYSSYRTILGELDDDLLMEKIDVHFDNNFYISTHLYYDSKIAVKKPAVLVCPGYGQPKNWSDTVNMCMALARAGFAAISVDYDGTGERADIPDVALNINNVTAVANLLGYTDIGLRVMNNMAVLKYLKSRDDINKEHIGITGLCQGAIVTWFTASICEEFKAVAPVCGATTYEAIALEYCNRQGGWSGNSPYVFDMLNHCDVQHLLAAIAPRPLFVQNNIVDVHWPYSGFEKVNKLTRQIYELYGAPDKRRFMVDNNPHAFAGTFITNLVEWFSDVLKFA